LTNTTRITVKNVDQVHGPIEINALKGDSVVQTKWLEPSKKGTISLNGTDFTAFAIDKSKDIPEVNR
jgi:hypothetical protein